MNDLPVVRGCDEIAVLNSVEVVEGAPKTLEDADAPNTELLVVVGPNVALPAVVVVPNDMLTPKGELDVLLAPKVKGFEVPEALSVVATADKTENINSLKNKQWQKELLV